MKNDFLLLFSTWNKRVSTRLYRVGRALPGLIKNARLLLNILVLRCSFYEFITRLKLYNVIYGRRANYRKVKRHGSSFGFDSHSHCFQWIGSVRSIVLQGGKIILKLSIRISEYRVCLMRKDFVIIDITLENLDKRILNKEIIIVNYWIEVSL